MNNTLTDRQLQRYSRNMRVPSFGKGGQAALLSARVLVIGAGGLGSPVLTYLAAAGVGHITVADADRVDLSNLQRQTIHKEVDVGRLKATSAQDFIQALNSDVEVQTVLSRVGITELLELGSSSDLIIDCTDNFETRYASADVAEALRVPHVWGAVHRGEGYASATSGRTGVSYRDLFPSSPEQDLAPDCSVAGVLGPICGVIGGLMASEAIRLLTTSQTNDFARLIHLNLDNLEQDVIEYDRDPNRPRVSTEDLFTAETLIQPLEVSAADAHEMVESGIAKLIDVREWDEIHAEPITGAVPLPLSTLDIRDVENRLAGLQGVFVCASGGRSRSAAVRSRAGGLTSAVSLAGGRPALMMERELEE